MNNSQIEARPSRKYLRTNTRVRGEYRKQIPGKTDIWVIFETETLGTGGLMFHSTGSFAIGDRIEIRLDIEGKSVSATTKILRVDQVLVSSSFTSLISVTLQFMEIDPAARLRLNNYIFPIITRH